MLLVRQLCGGAAALVFVAGIATAGPAHAFGDPEHGGSRVRAARPEPAEDGLFLPDPYLDPSWPELEDDTPGLKGEGTSGSVLDSPLDAEQAERDAAAAADQEEARKAVDAILESPLVHDTQADDPLPHDAEGIGKEYEDPVEW